MAIDFEHLSADLLPQIRERLATPATLQRAMEASQLCRIEWAIILDRAHDPGGVPETELRDFGWALTQCREQLLSLGRTDDRAVAAAARRTDDYIRLVDLLRSKGLSAVSAALEEACADLLVEDQSEDVRPLGIRSKS